MPLNSTNGSFARCLRESEKVFSRRRRRQHKAQCVSALVKSKKNINRAIEDSDSPLLSTRYRPFHGLDNLHYRDLPGANAPGFMLSPTCVGLNPNPAQSRLTKP